MSSKGFHRKVQKIFEGAESTKVSMMILFGAKKYRNITKTEKEPKLQTEN